MGTGDDREATPTRREEGAGVRQDVGRRDARVGAHGAVDQHRQRVCAAEAEHAALIEHAPAAAPGHLAQRFGIVQIGEQPLIAYRHPRLVARTRRQRDPTRDEVRALSREPPTGGFATDAALRMKASNEAVS
ncbi:MAG: hypothetical protein ABI629_24070 [bacterium]